MPTYVYACQDCDDRLEVIQKMSDAPLTKCEKCGGGLRRVLFPPAVVYKGPASYYRLQERRPETREGGEVRREQHRRRRRPPRTRKSESKSETASKPETKTEAKTEAGSGTK